MEDYSAYNQDSRLKASPCFSQGLVLHLSKEPSFTRKAPRHTMAHPPIWTLDIGATVTGPDQVTFRVWAPHAKHVAVKLLAPQSTEYPLTAQALGYFSATIPGIPPGSRYLFHLDQKTLRPDPASRWQPEGVHHPSAVVNPNTFQWTDQQWKGMPLHDFIIYELHTGTFTQEGSFQGILPFLSYLKNEIGITAIELMPVAQFPGARNWGYDGTYLYAVHNTYGGPDGLKQFVNACHSQGLAVILDVVYNHLGPEGNYLGDFGPYFTNTYQTPWGSAINYDGPDSDEVRHYIINNAIYWIHEYHIDALRLDAVHGIFDFGAYHILQELQDRVQAEARTLGRTVSVIAESDLNNIRYITPSSQGGYGLDGTWNDDFHHALHSLITGERDGYYQDFGSLDDLACAFREGYVYSGRQSIFRRRRHGNSSKGHPPSQFVVFAQNHDQIGNRATGERLSALAPKALKVAAAAVLLSPNVPLMFMGEEYGETAPFQYFIDHGDPGLVEAVRKGRKNEFLHFGWKPNQIPDPSDQETFERSRIHPGVQKDQSQNDMLRWTRSLIHIRTTIPAFGSTPDGTSPHQVYTFHQEKVLILHRRGQHGSEGLLILCFNSQTQTLSLSQPVGEWNLLGHSDQELPKKSQTEKTGTSLSITAKGTRLSVPAYGVLIFTNGVGI